MTTKSDEMRGELAAFLKSRRARLSPIDVGFASGRGRRTPGLRREEVAALSGVGLTWYTALEQGKAIQVSAAFLENLARGLRLSSAERAHLFVLAQQRLPPMPPARLARPRYADLQAMLDCYVFPAYARTSYFDVEAWNAPNTAMFGDFAAIPASDRNVVRLMFLRSYHRRTMPNWEADARAIVAKLRLNLGRAIDKAPFLTLVQDLSDRSTEFRRIWGEHEVEDEGEGVTLFHSPRHGKHAFRHHLLMPENWPDLRIVLYLSDRRDPAP